MAKENFFVRELTGRRLVFWIIWFSIHWGLFAFGWWKQETDPRLAGLNTLQYSVWLSRGAGLVLGFDGAIILLPVCRNLMRFIRPPLQRFIPMDENIWFHRQVAYQILFFTMVHVCAHYVNFFNVEKAHLRGDLKAWEIHYTEAGGITGHAMLLFMLLMYTTAHHKIRNQCFEAFWYTHHLAFFFLLCLYTHATGCFVRDTLNVEPGHCLGYETWRFTIWGGILYFLERMLRLYRAYQPTKINKVIMHPSGAMEIQFDKPSFKYKSGQWLFLNVPEVARFQWHPFTITSSPFDPYVSVHIRQVGDFTKALGDRLGCNADQAGDKEKLMAISGSQLPRLMIDGPYGAPAEDVFNHEVAVLVGTGIGVTPWASVLKNIWYHQQKGTLKGLRRVEFFWICRDTGNFEWFQSLLKDLEASQTDPNFLRIHIYLTQKINQDMIHNIVLNDVGGSYDPLTDLQSRTHFGRPNFGYIFEQMRIAIVSGKYLPGRESSLRTQVGVYYCGPNALAKQLKKDTAKACTPDVDFKFSKEHF